MKVRYICIFIFSIVITFCGCNNKSFGMIDSSEPIHINRFDSVLYQWIDSDNYAILEEVKDKYPQMPEILGKSLFKTDYIDTSSLFNYIINYYSEPTLKALYKDAVTFYSNDSPEFTEAKKELSFGFMQIKKEFPSMQIPAVYMHVSGLQQNIIIADSLLSFSIDKYMGTDYALYKDFFNSYQRKSMTPERLAKDGLSAWIKTEYPYQGKENVLLERMIYEGKIIYILMQTGYNYTYENIISITEDEYKWCREYESSIWTLIVERKHLYTPDIATTQKYLLPFPSTFISEDAPGNIGNFIGYRIIEHYMKQTKSTCEELMNNNDAQDILQKSKYKP